MRPVHLLALGGLLVGCAHASETYESSGTVVAVPLARELVVVDEPPPPESAPPPARPRLTRTITLGQSNEAADYSGPTPPPPAGAGGNANTNNVVVNNNVIVQQSPPRFYGGYGGYGYGYGAHGRGASRSGFSSRGATGRQWGSTGFEGARRTAAPGQTPAVGGNWAP